MARPIHITYSVFLPVETSFDAVRVTPLARCCQMAETRPPHSGRSAPTAWSPAELGRCWGEGAARCFHLQISFWSDGGCTPRLEAVPGSLVCPISRTVMSEPVVTADGCAYEREQIERWIRERRQQRQPITSPVTGLELPSATLLPLLTLKHAVEAFLAQCPELQQAYLDCQSMKVDVEALQNEVAQKQKENVMSNAELSITRDHVEALSSALARSEASRETVKGELVQARATSHAAGLRVAFSPKPTLQASPTLDADGHAFTVGVRTDDVVEAPHRDRDDAIDTVRVDRALELATHLGASEGGGSDQCGMACLGDGSSAMAPVVPQPARAANASQKHRGTDSVSCVIGRCRVGCGPGAKLVDMFFLSLAISAVAIFLFLRSLQSGAPGPISSTNMSTSQTPRSAIPILVVNHEVTSPAHPRLLVRFLSSGDLEDQRRAARALTELARVNATAVLHAGAVAPLVGLCQNIAAGAASEAAAALGALAASSAKGQTWVVRSGAVPPLIGLLQCELLEVRLAALGALNRILASNELYQVAAARAGAAPAIVRLLEDASPHVRAGAASALGSLTAEAGWRRFDRQVGVVQAGAAAPLVSLLGCPYAEPAERMAAVVAIHSLVSGNPYTAAAFAQVGAAAPLAAMLDDAAPQIRKAAALVLAALAGEGAEAADIAAAAAHETFYSSIAH